MSSSVPEHLPAPEDEFDDFDADQEFLPTLHDCFAWLHRRHGVLSFYRHDDKEALAVTIRPRDGKTEFRQWIRNSGHCGLYDALRAALLDARTMTGWE